MAALDATREAHSRLETQFAAREGEADHLRRMLRAAESEAQRLRDRMSSQLPLEQEAASLRAEVQAYRSAIQTAQHREASATHTARMQVEQETARLRHELLVSEGDRQKLIAVATMARYDYDRLAASALAVEQRETALSAIAASAQERVEHAERDRDQARQQAAAEVVRAALLEKSAGKAVAEAQGALALVTARAEKAAEVARTAIADLSSQLADAKAGIQMHAATIAEQEEMLAAAHAKIEDLQRQLQDMDAPGPVLPHAPMERHATAIMNEDDALCYSSVDTFLDHLRKIGMSSAQLILGVDCTKSNLWSGKISFGGRSLHDVSDVARLTPYQQIMGIIGRAMMNFDDDGLIPMYGFGCSKTQEHSVFSFKPNDEPCNGVEEAIEVYRAVMPTVNLAGPTSFAPIVKKAIEIVKKDKQFTVVLIIADGQVTAVKETEAAIVEASKYPIAIICVGVGDGPWDDMERFDDGLPERKVDNFQFLEFNEVKAKALAANVSLDLYFTLAALAELPTLIPEMKKARVLK